MDLGIRGRRALVSAGSKGLGYAAAERLAEAGCKVAICSRSPENVQSAADALNTKYEGTVIGSACDLDKPEDIKAFHSFAVKEFGGVDILVNNCGGPPAGFFEDLEEAQWQGAYEQVLLSVIRFIKLVLPGMKEQQWGRIINITSLSVKEPVDNLILSTTFRDGILGMSKTLSNQVGEFNITINNIAPGLIGTERLDHLAESIKEQSGTPVEDVFKNWAASMPMKRIGKPEDIGSLAAFLASEWAGYLTGNTIHVDGGKIKSLW